MFTVCPKCALTLVVTAADLRVAQGYVRCGRCSSVFNALAQLSDERAAARDAEAAAEPEPEEPASTPAEEAAMGQSASAASPAADDEELIPDIDLEFDPATTDASSVFVAAAPSPEWTAATGSFKALVSAKQEPPAPEPKPAEADEDIDIELDAELLSDIVQSEPAPPAVAESAPAPPREAPPPGPPRESRPAAPREAPPPAPPRESRPAAPREMPPPAPRESAPAAASKPAAAPKPAALKPPAAPAPAPAQPPAAQKQPSPAAVTAPAAPTTAAKSAAAAKAAPAAPAPESAEVRPEDPDAGNTGTSALLEAAGKPRITARATWAWAAGSVLLALVLVAQLIDHSRDTLATDPRFSRSLTALYSALGVTLMPRWDLRAYDVRQLGATVGQGSLGAITVRASIRNSGQTPQPPPLLRVTLQDRFGNRLASRDVTPRDYLPQSIAPTAFLSRDQRVDAELAFVDPGANAVGFELDACLPMGGGIACANDTTAR